jgi:hypothetical protein
MKRIAKIDETELNKQTEKEVLLDDNSLWDDFCEATLHILK